MDLPCYDQAVSSIETQSRPGSYGHDFVRIKVLNVAPVFDAGDVVVGSLTIHSARGAVLQDLVCDLRLQINSIVHKTCQEYHPFTAIVSRSTLGHVLAHDKRLRAGTVYTIPFNVSIPSLLPLDFTSLPQHKLLPGTIDGRIEYSLCAQLVGHNGKPVAIATESLRIEPSYPFRDALQDTPGLLSFSKKLRRATLTAHILGPLVYNVNKTTNRMKIHLCYRSSINLMVKSISYKLHGYTLVSQKPLQFVPDLKQVGMHMTKSDCGSGTVDMSINWSSAKSGLVMSDFNLPLKFHPGLVASFTNFLVCRRYYLEISVISTDGNLAFTIPIMVEKY